MPAIDELSPTRAAEVSFPDPLLTASIYAEGQLDAVLLRVVLPLWRLIAPGVTVRGGYLWTVRYARRGEHLKLRLHAPEELDATLRAAFEEELRPRLAELAPVEKERALRAAVPAIDVEDEGDEVEPDLSVAWTGYRRSFVSLGAEPWLSDDRYAALETAWLGAGFALVAAAVEGLEGDDIPHRTRQTALLKAVIAGISALGLGRGAGDYLAYHRDWLLRFFVQDPEREAAFLARLDQQVAAIPAMIEQLKRVIEASWGEEGVGSDEADATDAHAVWRVAAGRLAAYAEGFRGRSEHSTDPFTEEPAFPAAFKAFHGTANQLGLSPMEEAFVYHLLWRAGEYGPAATAEREARVS